MAPLVAFPLILLGFAVVVLLGLWIASRLPMVRCRKWTRFAIAAALFLATFPLTVWCSTWGSNALVILLAYGSDEFATGLWIINKHGELSDGRVLPDFWMGVWGALMFLSYLVPTLPVVVFWMITDRPAERGADTAEALYYRGYVRQQHGLYADAIQDFEVAVELFTAFFRYVAEIPPEERDHERIERMKDYLQRSRDALRECQTCHSSTSATQ